MKIMRRPLVLLLLLSPMAMGSLRGSGSRLLPEVTDYVSVMWCVDCDWNKLETEYIHKSVFILFPRGPSSG